jgi:molybdopterin-dependent oxidoreductase alpha subunit
VRGHSNVQGDRTMGIYEKPAPAFLDRLRAVFGFEPPRADGHDVVGAIGAMQRGEIDVFVALGGNFALASPDSVRTQAALRRCALTAHVATKLNRSHLVHGRDALILPCLGRTEIDLQAEGPQGVTVEDSMSMVHISTGMNAPASAHLLSEPAIVARMAHATLPHSRVDWLSLIGHYDRIRDRIAQCIEGFEDFNARVRVPGGFHLRNPAREREWRTPDGRAQLMPHPLHGAARDPTLLQLMTVRSHDQYNTTIYGLNDRYRGVDGERRPLFVSAADLNRLGLRAGERVDLVSVWHDGERVAEDFLLVGYAIPVGCVASYFPETNALVPLDHHAERARTPASKSIPVRLRRRLGAPA